MLRARRGNGLLTLISTGATATVTQWQSALRSVTYQNTSADNPSAGNRLFTLTEVECLGACVNAPVIAIEEVRNPIAAITRSWRLTKGNSLRIFAPSILKYDRIVD